METTTFFIATKNFKMPCGGFLKENTIVKYVGIEWGTFDDDTVGIRYDDVALEVRHKANVGHHYFNLPKSILKPLHSHNDRFQQLWDNLTSDISHQVNTACNTFPIIENEINQLN